MRPYSLIAIFAFCVSSIQAQSIYNEAAWGGFNSDCQATHNRYGFNSKRDQYKEQGIKKVIVLKHSFNKDSVLQSSRISRINYLDSLGNIVRADYFDDDGSLSTAAHFKYNAKNQLIESRSRTFYWRKKWNEYIQQYTYFNDSLYSSKTYFRKKHNGKKGPEWKYTFQFTEENQIKEVQSWKLYRSKKDLESRSEFEYYPNGQKKESRYYDEDNKLKRKYTYDCNINYTDVGQKNSTGICQLTDTLDNGAIRSIKEFTTGKGGVYREISDWHPEEEWSVFKRYNRKNKLIYESHYQKLSTNHSRVVVNYKGKKFLIPYSVNLESERFRDELGNINTWEVVDKPFTENYVFYEYIYKRD